MTVFAVIATTPKPELDAVVSRIYAGDSLRINDTVWLVSDDVSTIEVCRKLGIDKTGIRGTVVLPTGGSYFGVAAASIWEWLKSKWEGVNGR